MNIEARYFCFQIVCNLLNFRIMKKIMAVMVFGSTVFMSSASFAGWEWDGRADPRPLPGGNGYSITCDGSGCCMQHFGASKEPTPGDKITVYWPGGGTIELVLMSARYDNITTDGHPQGGSAIAKSASISAR